MGRRKALSDVEAPALPAVVAQASSFAAPATMGDFTQGTDGNPRLTWARTQQGPVGYGWNAASGSLYAVPSGGRTAREARLASAVAIDLVTKNPTLMTIVETFVTNIMGPAGLTLSSKPAAALLGISPEAARKLSTSIEVAWNAWANNPKECDLTGRNDVHALGATFLRHLLLSGEGLATIDWQRCRDARTKTKVSLLDPLQLDHSQTRTVDGGNAVSGVVFNTFGRVTGYMLQDVPLGAMTFTGAVKYVPAATPWGRTMVIHVFEQVDARQVRGLSPLVAALTPANEKESLTEFTLANALIQTSFAATVQSDLPAAQALNGMDVGGGSPGFEELMTAREQFYAQTKIALSPGVVNHLPPGDKLSLNKAPNDGAAFEPFTKALTQSAARASGAMVEEISGYYGDTSFSASRLAQELPYRTTLRRRRLFIERFYGEVFRAWLDEAVATGTVTLPEGAPDYFENREHYSNALWRGIGRAEPDRKKAAEADALELELGLATYESKLAERGIDMDSHLESLAAERVLMRKVGLDKPFFPGSTTTQIRDEKVETIQETQAEDPDNGV